MQNVNMNELFAKRIILSTYYQRKNITYGLYI
jgi:hypothetical protein